MAPANKGGLLNIYYYCYEYMYIKQFQRRFNSFLINWTEKSVDVQLLCDLILHSLLMMLQTRNKCTTTAFHLSYYRDINAAVNLCSSGCQWV